MRVCVYVCVCVCVCKCVIVCVHAHARACVNTIRIVSMDKILRFTNTLIIILTLSSSPPPSPLQTHTTVAAYIVAGDNYVAMGDNMCHERRRQNMPEQACLLQH